MSDQGPRGKGIPSWQRDSQQPVSSDPNQTSNTESATKPTQSQPTPPDVPHHSVAEGDVQPVTGPALTQEELLDQGMRFLSDERMQTEPLHKKIEFLQSKGLTRETIEKALDLTSTAPTNKLDDNQASQETRQVAIPPKPSQPAELQQRQDIPPIITYPEHLMHSQKPPPIITASRLLNTAYVASAVGAAFYGLSRFLVKPMTDTLTHARHDLALRALEQIDDLNEKLAGVVSKEPSTDGAGQSNPEIGSDDEDPTELFHRDYGTQTEASLERGVSGLSTPSSSDENVDITQLHTHKLNKLREAIHSIASETGEETKSQEETSSIIKMLNESLESMAYPSVASFTSDRYGIYQDYAPKDKNGKDKEDEIARMKSEIRSFKGTLLSARHFPASAGNVSGGARGQVFG